MTLDHFLWLLFVVLFVMYSHLFSQLYLIYHSPHVPFSSTPTFAVAARLVNCAKYRLPLIRWEKIETCLQNSTVYSVRNGRIPYMEMVPTAFVFSPIDNSSIFLTSKYNRLDIEAQALVVIHECAHTALGVQDLAYVWQTQFQFLTEREHLNNADSYSYKVWKLCGNPYSSIY